MTAHRIEQHIDGRWQLVGWAFSLRFFNEIRDRDLSIPTRLKHGESGLTIALHDPRRNYAYPTEQEVTL